MELENPTTIKILIGYINDNFKSLIENKEIFNETNLELDYSIKILPSEEIDNIEIASFNNLIDQTKLGKSNFIAYLIKYNDKYNLVSIRINPEDEYDWKKVILDFIENYHNQNTDKNGYFKWGQVVPETAEYMCVDCGLILELTKDSIFPICEVCLSGDPSATDAKSNEGFWEKI